MIKIILVNCNYFQAQKYRYFKRTYLKQKQQLSKNELKPTLIQHIHTRWQFHGIFNTSFVGIAKQNNCKKIVTMPPSGIRPPADPKGPPFVLFWDIQFWLTGLKIFLKAPIYILIFRGERAPKKHDFLVEIFLRKISLVDLKKFDNIFKTWPTYNSKKVNDFLIFFNFRKKSIWSQRFWISWIFCDKHIFHQTYHIWKNIYKPLGNLTTKIQKRIELFKAISLFVYQRA